MGLFWNPTKSTEQISVTKNIQEEPKKKFERKITVKYIDKTLTPDVFTDVDDVDTGTFWTSIRLKKDKQVILISNSQIRCVNIEWITN